MNGVETDRLGEYLKVRRQALAPERAGLVRGGLRRTPGLRREEVATLADVSVDYYERLERSRATNPSAAVIARLAVALQLDPDETSHLYRLAGHPAPAPAPERQVDPSILFLLDSLDATPAHVLDTETNVLAQNALSVALFGDFVGRPGRERNMAWRWFTDPRTRAHNIPEEHEEIGRGWTAELRGVVAEQGSAGDAARLVAELREASTEFAGYWTTMEVYRFRTMRKTFVHPVTGTIEVNCDMVPGPAGSPRLMVLRPEPGSDVARRLRRLHESLAGPAGAVG
ncbi:transcriptional regulator [Virgisporangium aliadipatigenens]|uniref:Transcriptional regulator n=1 Tax=Virgisporangium aliadipatigenens TaxID=741659 RepID=A0A8J3YQQ2_9ACTN|nr:helix-turn-helix transcriptional regulator [Virgisporangium aliadipatigenens]GIJ48255.1 transcriptional regulator [Virgisporangium aliadipatigenens]